MVGEKRKGVGEKREKGEKTEKGVKTEKGRGVLIGSRRQCFGGTTLCVVLNLI